MSKTVSKKIYNAYDRPKGKGLACDKTKGVAQQSFKDECDINNVVDRYMKTGTWSGSIAPATRIPVYGNFANLPDYQGCLDRLNAAQADFDALPATIRRRFDNNPALLIDFLSDKANREEAEALGIVKKAEAIGGAGEAGVSTPSGSEKK